MAGASSQVSGNLSLIFYFPFINLRLNLSDYFEFPRVREIGCGDCCAEQLPMFSIKGI